MTSRHPLTITGGIYSLYWKSEGMRGITRYLNAVEFGWRCKPEAPDAADIFPSPHHSSPHTLKPSNPNTPPRPTAGTLTHTVAQPVQADAQLAITGDDRCPHRSR
jgi:hypothetical protein